MIEQLKNILNENNNKRICILGTSCTGKTTLIEQTGIGKDMDEEIFPLLTQEEEEYVCRTPWTKEIFPLLTQEEEEYVCRTPWTKEIGNYMDNLVKSKLKIEPGIPLLGTVLLDCDLIVYLHINDELLKMRTEKRNVDFINAKNMQKAIEEDINNSNIKTITIEVSDEYENTTNKHRVY